MFSHHPKPIPSLSSVLRRVLVVDANEARARAASELLSAAGRPDVWTAPSAAKALKLAAKVDPGLVLCELAGDGVDGPAFTRALRRSDLACRKAAVVLIGAGAEAASILAARDSGAHEVLARPFTGRDLLRRVDAALLQPREWVEAMDYVGPDRRRFNTGAEAETARRQADLPLPPDAVRLGQAFKILRAAVAAAEADPGQARRAVVAQAEILRAVAEAMADQRLAAASAAFQAYLQTAAETPLRRAEVERQAAPLLAYMPREDGRAAA